MPHGKTTLGELMGSHGAASSTDKEMTMDDLPKLLGDGMPKIPRSPIGRLRLLRSLKQRFGDGFKSIPGVTNIIKDFDQEVSFAITMEKMKRIKGKG